MFLVRLSGSKFLLLGLTLGLVSRYAASGEKLLNVLSYLGINRLNGACDNMVATDKRQLKTAFSSLPFANR